VRADTGARSAAVGLGRRRHRCGDRAGAYGSRSETAWRALQARLERLERELRQAIDASADRASMQIGARLAQLQDALTAHVTQITGVQAEQLGAFGRAMQQQLADLTAAIQRHLAEVRTTLETRLQALQQGNETRLEQMRATVEEKLQTTLEARLGESFRLVSERLEQVHKGLGEMQVLAAGVGDLKRVLGNVKSRGVFGEVQLASLLDQVLLTDQYAANVATRAGIERAGRFRGPVAGPHRRRHGMAADRRQVSDRGL